MKRLVLMRHAKAEAHASGGDHARHLTRIGLQDAQDAGVALRGLGLEGALVSTSARTRETFAALGLDATARFSDDLYLGGTDTVVRLISSTDEGLGSLIVVGHAPSIPDLAARLLFAGDPREADRVGSWFPTSAYSTFTFEGTWHGLLDRAAVGYEGTTRRR